MTHYPKISLVTPNLNGENFLERTIQSVTDQDYPNIEYIIMDGGSQDQSMEIIERNKSRITHFETNPDKGLYHALQKGFDRSTGEIMGWINSDDILQKNALLSVAEIFSLASDIQWIQGYPTVIDESDRIVYQRSPVYKPGFFLEKRYHDGRFIQQESTFWTRELWNTAGAHFNPELNYAGDFELWMRFFQHSPLHLTTAILGSFRTRSSGQISKNNYHLYLSECDNVIDRITEQKIKLCDLPGKMASYNFSKNSFILGEIK